ncbi:LysR family transcriptional regulator [Neobacillus niacini]|uniref:LysR family transcriptional regulator n=1 Tax=Neobacillus niacini TaxID=86668 RepID=UPI002FFF32D8
MNLEHLKIFYMVAMKKNFSETAKALHMSQPSVSLQVRQLEESLGTKLFNRTTKKVYLTPAGELLAKSAKNILKHRVDTISEQLGFDRQRLLKAAVALGTLYACWGVEDQADWETTYQCVKWFIELLN